MSANYQETAVSGIQWKRCTRLVLNNPFGGVPSVRFEEEEAIGVGERTLTFPVNEMFVKPFSVSGSFPILNPENGVPAGPTMTHTELITILYSLYIACATERDGA